MTAIAGLIDGDKVWIGGDSAGVGGYSLSVRKDPKVFKIDEFLIGYTSSFRMGQILRFFLVPPPVPENEDEFAYMVKCFVPAVRTVLKDNGYLKILNNEETAGTFIVGWRGRLFLIDEDLQVGEDATPYVACGCGQDLILGALYSMSKSKEKLTPAEKIKRALSASEAFSAGVRSPFKVLST